MPYCHVADHKPRSKGCHGSNLTKPQGQENVQIFYQLYGHGSTKVLFIIGLASTHDAWSPQLIGLCGTDTPNEAEGAGSADGKAPVDLESHGTTIEDCLSKYSEHDRKSKDDSKTQAGNGIQVCTFDNRGVGKSTIPKGKAHYSTRIMAEDALALLDHLGWSKAHVCGHSMGGMIACKLAAIAPTHVASLTLIGVTGGGYQCLPKINRKTISIAYRLCRAKTPEERADVDLDTHFTPDYLEALVGAEKRRILLYKEYVKNLMKGGMQPRYGLEGQASACWNHSLSSDDLNAIRSAGVIVAVIHGRHDVIAQVEHARKLASKLHPVARMVELPGGHLVTHQNTDEVNKILLDMTRVTEMNVQYFDWKTVDAGAPYGEGGEQSQKEDTCKKGVKAGGTWDRNSQEPSRGSWVVVSVLDKCTKKLVPEWVELLYVFPFLHWTSAVVLVGFGYC